jgi:hypothetical protein
MVQYMVLHATLDLSGCFYRFEPWLFDALYDTEERPPARDMLCIPVLRFTNAKVHPMTDSPQVHGILAVPVARDGAGGREGHQGEGLLECFRRVGYCWTRNAASLPAGSRNPRRIRLV